jgi:hypothetical protein
MRRVDPTALVGVCALLVFAAALALYQTTNRFDAWAPNAGTEAISVLVTVVVVGAILKRQKERRLRPRREYAMESVDYMLHLLVTSIAGDYIETHPDRAEQVDPNLEAILDHCVSSLRRGDEDSPRREYDGLPGIFRAQALRVADLGRRPRTRRSCTRPRIPGGRERDRDPILERLPVIALQAAPCLLHLDENTRLPNQVGERRPSVVAPCDALL